MAFLLPVKKATHLKRVPLASARGQLDGRLAGRLGQVLGDAAEPLRQHHPGDRHRRPQSGETAESSRKPSDLRGQAHGQHALDAVARGQPAADQVGHHARRLIEQEEEGQREGRVAEPEEVQQHQHAQRAIGEREAPIGGGDDGVVASRLAPVVRPRSMWQARSTMRQA
jgi:hypothetical protein